MITKSKTYKRHQCDFYWVKIVGLLDRLKPKSKSANALNRDAILLDAEAKDYADNFKKMCQLYVDTLPLAAYGGMPREEVLDQRWLFEASVHIVADRFNEALECCNRELEINPKNKVAKEFKQKIAKIAHH